MPTKKLSRRLKPDQVAELWNCDRKKVYQLIDAGELLAINIALPDSKTPRWVVPEDSIEAFEQSRSNLTEEARAQRRRRIRRSSDPYASVLD